MSKTCKAVAPLLLLFLSFQILYARENSSSVSPQTIKLIREAPSRKGLATGALILLKESRYRVGRLGSTRYILRVVGKVYTEKARADYSEIEVPFNSFYDDARLDFARTITDSGTVQNVSSDAVQVKTSSGISGASAYSDERYISFALPGLAPGVGFEFQVTFTGKKHVIPGQWFQYHMFAYLLTSPSVSAGVRADPVLKSEYVLTVPKGSRFQKRFFVDSVKAIVAHDNGQDIYNWTMSDLPALKIENDMPSWNQTEPGILLSTVRKWSQIDSWAEDTIASRASTGPRIVNEAKKLTISDTSRTTRIRSIFQFIQRKIQYISADLSRGGYRPHSPEEVLRSKYGDCKDQAILFISLLNAVGIKAYPALLSPYPDGQYTALPTPYFSHVIVYIPMKKRSLWLDTTPTVIAFPDLAYPDQNREAFIVNGKGGELVKTPGSSAQSNAVYFTFGDKFVNGNLIMSMKFRGTGAMSEAFKGVFKTMTSHQIFDYFRSVLLPRYPSAQIDTAYVSSLDTPDSDFSAGVRFRIDSALNTHRTGIKFAAAAAVPLTQFGGIDPDNMSSTRHSDMINDFLFEVVGTEVYSPPAKTFLALTAPAPDSMNDSLLEFRRRFTVTDTSITAHWVLRSKSMLVPEGEYSHYLKDMQSIGKLANWSACFFNPMSFWVNLASQYSASAIVSQCTDFLRQNPDSALVLLMKGNADFELGRNKTSLDEIRKVLDMTRGNAYGYVWIGNPLGSMGKYDRALSYADSAIRIDPDLRIAYLERATCYMSQDKLNLCLRDLKKAYSLDTLAYMTLDQMGTIYLSQDKYREALSTFRRAIVLDSSVADLFNGLGQAYLGLDSAREAVKSFRTGTILDTTNSDLYCNLGWAYYECGDYDSCTVYTRKSIEFDSTGYVPRSNLALVELRLGHVREARGMYKELSVDTTYDNSSAVKGAIGDLHTLMRQGVQVREARKILKDFYGVDPRKK